MSKSSALEEILSRSDYADGMDIPSPGAPGRKPASAKPPAAKHLRTTQAWRKVEDALDNRRLDKKLKEVYED